MRISYVWQEGIAQTVQCIHTVWPTAVAARMKLLVDFFGALFCGQQFFSHVWMFPFFLR